MDAAVRVTWHVFVVPKIPSVNAHYKAMWVFLFLRHTYRTRNTILLMFVCVQYLCVLLVRPTGISNWTCRAAEGGRFQQRRWRIWGGSKDIGQSKFLVKTVVEIRIHRRVPVTWWIRIRVLSARICGSGGIRCEKTSGSGLRLNWSLPTVYCITVNICSN